MLKAKLKIPDKAKLKLPEKAKSLFPDRLGSLVSGFQDVYENGGGSGSIFESGEELEILESNGFDLDKESEYQEDEIFDCEEEVKVKVRMEKEKAGPVSAKDAIAADEKRSNLEFELSQKEINLEKLQRMVNSGLPDGGSVRATAWKLLLGYLPPSRDSWANELTQNRLTYHKLKEELLLSPSEFARRKNEAMASKNQSADSFGDGPLMRQKYAEIADQIDRDLLRTHPDMKFFSGETPASKKHREAMRNILLLFAKLNPEIQYVQGMNEVLAPIYYVFSTDSDEQNAANAEADSFSCFVRLMSDSVDHFCQQLDNSAVGIHSTLSRLSDLLRSNDEELWRHLEFKTKVNPQFYAFRWITLLLTQEFDFQSIMRIWDSLLGNPFGVQDMLLRICCAMLLCVKSKLLTGDFAANLKLLQHYPEINLEYLLQVARDLSQDSISL